MKVHHLDHTQLAALDHLDPVVESWSPDGLTLDAIEQLEHDVDAELDREGTAHPTSWLLMSEAERAGIRPGRRPLRAVAAQAATSAPSEDAA
ncbi:hypothetical protein [Pseudonocardia acidicola]|uniref:Uncharacterized protein n=1 Tax=Pseudonocardia acidicola TaxID=2724939 RepID=A0ABX1SKK8_9PSEU|nr:hypothetical protein [Pseudonocardia acidicola]NMI02081.1 hypothetical protein [Pseudonocardia acidicola]